MPTNNTQRIFSVRKDGYPHGRVGHFLVWAENTEDPMTCGFNPDAQAFVLLPQRNVVVAFPLYWTYIYTLTMVKRAFQFGE